MFTIYISTVIDFTEPATVGKCAIGLAVLIRLVLAYRRFNRTGIAGTQYFRNYGMYLLIGLVEWLAKLLATILVITGVFMCIRWR